MIARYDACFEEALQSAELEDTDALRRNPEMCVSGGEKLWFRV